MTLPFTYRGPGDPLVIFSDEYNAFIDAGLAERRRVGGFVPSSIPPQAFDPGVVLAKCEAGVGFPQNAVVELRNPVFGSGAGFEDRVVFSAVTPTPNAAFSGIAIEGCEARASGSELVMPVVVSGYAVADVLIVDEAHEFAMPRGGDATKLESGWAGYHRIVHKQDVAGTAKCVLSLGHELVGRWFRVSASAASGDPAVRYTYSGLAARKTGIGHGTWADLGSGDAITLYHTLEEINDGSGVEGHGVNIDSLPGTFGIKPIPVGTPVFAVPIQRPITGGFATEWWITAVAPIDGECDSVVSASSSDYGVIT